MEALQASQAGRPRQTSPLMYFLMFAFCLFIGILIFTYMVTKRTRPVYVDDHGNAVNSQASDDQGGAHK